VIDLETVDLASLELTMETSKGSMSFRFFHEEAPCHSRNIAQLAMDGFYNGLAFHRIIKSFMIQGGCPNTREGATGHPGTGGPGHSVNAEFSALQHERGVLSMARSADPNSAGSQFFVVHGEHVASLDGQYTVFAHMVSGHDVLDAIASVECEFGPSRERSQPTERVDIITMSVAVIEAPVEEPEENPEADASDAPAADFDLSKALDAEDARTAEGRSDS
jgi:peptidyl-prolyl cis-trans isomerase B (cyclophilin B)